MQGQFENPGSPFLECFEFKTALPTPLGLTFFFLWFRHLLSFPVRQKRPRFSGKARVTSRHPPHRPRTRKPLAFSRNRSILQVAAFHCPKPAAGGFNGGKPLMGPGFPFTGGDSIGWGNPAVNTGAGMPGAGGEDVGFGVPHSHKTTPGGGVAAQGY